MQPTLSTGGEPAPFQLQRFLMAQAGSYEVALQELRQGQKRSHWMWFIFPQAAGLGRSVMAEAYAIRSRAEAKAYLCHPVLGQRLEQCCEALLQHEGRPVRDILGAPDDLKLGSSLTLFAMVAPPDSIFQRVLDVFYSGQRDDRTVSFLNLT